MTDFSNMKRRGKGVSPPSPDDTNSNLEIPRSLRRDTRAKPSKNAHVQFSIPLEVVNEFSIEAGKRFGFRKGSKSELFMAIWEDYKSKNNR